MIKDQHPRPIWRISIAGEDLTSRIQPRLGDLTLTDNRGTEADQLDIKLDDSDGLLQIPPRGAVIRLAIGWAHAGLVDKGTYVVDEIEHAGAPDTLTIRARSADLRESLGEKRERSWHRQTVGEIARQIAGEHELTPVISPDLAGLMVDHIDQTSESDASFLSRLAGMFDALSTVKDGRLLFYRIGRGVSVSGLALGTATIRRADGDSHRFSFADRETAGAVRACYYDTGKREKREVIVTAEPSDKKAGKTSDRIKTLRHTYANRSNAERAAKAELDKIQRGVATFSLTLAYGRPELIPDMPATVRGWKREIDEVDWLITKVTHRLSDSGYIADVEMEIDLGLDAGDAKEGDFSAEDW